MTPPLRFLWRMLGFLGVVVLVAALLSPQLASAFATNLVLNGLILGVLLIGVAWNLRQVLVLRPEVDWLEHFRSPRHGAPAQPAPKLLGPMASMFQARRSDRLSLSAGAMRSVLDGIGSRLDETRELSRYMTGLLIFLGLLGTFWGLLLTICSVSDVIAACGRLRRPEPVVQPAQVRPGAAAEGHGDGLLVVDARPRRGRWCWASSTSRRPGADPLLQRAGGMAGRITRLSSGVLGDTGAEGGSVPAYVQALLEQTAENLEGLQHILARGEEGRAQTSQALMTLTERLSTLTDQMRASQQLMLRVAEQQAALGPVLHRLAEVQATPAAADEVVRGHLRNTEIYLSRMLEEMTTGRAQATAELRSEIKLVARTIAALAEEQPR